MENKSIIGFIGAGNMAYALIKGLLDNGFDAECINISDPNEELLNERQSELKVRTFSNNMALLSNSDIIIFAVKPQKLSSVCLELKENVKSNHLFVSIVAGIKGSDINRWLGGSFSLVRTMQYTPALFQHGVTGLFANELVNNEQKNISDIDSLIRG
jgi:pyrroline-5-carboxylate reductase